MRSLLGGVVLLLALLTGVPASAQVVTSSTGAINGVVTDTSKAVLPGVTITAASPQMMGTRETVSDAEGRYQFAAIPPGEYSLTFDLAGFSKFIRDGIRIGLGFTGTVNAELQLATQQETITVTGQSPVVDTTSTKITNNYDAQTMASLPTARDFPALMAETPGVASSTIDVGGSAAMNQTNFVIYGMPAGNNQYIRTEGVVAPNLGNHYNDFGSFDEVQIETAAHTAEMPLVGVYANMITRSGGNAYHGTFYKDYQTSKWGATNIDDAQIARGVRGGGQVAAKDINKMLDYQDTNGGVGGYIKKDRLWWFGSARDNRMHSNFVNYPTEPAIQQVDSAQAKATYNQTPNHKFIYWYNYNIKLMPAYGFSGATLVYSANAPQDEDFPIGQTKIEYNAVLSPSLFLEVRAGKFFKTFMVYSKKPFTPRYTDNAAQTLTGSSAWNRQRDLRPQTNGSLSYFKRGWGTSHNFKVGWDIGQHQTPNDIRPIEGRDGPAGLPDIFYTLNNGVASQVQFNLSPQVTLSYLWTQSAYVNDTWQLNDRFSLNLGMRFDRYRNGYPDQVHLRDSFGGRFIPADIHFPANSDTLHFNAWGPRLGVVWNLRGDGKTLLKANYGSYKGRPANTLGNPAICPCNFGQGAWNKVYTWTDRNGDLLWQSGEEGLLVSEQGGTANTLIDPNWKLSVTRDFALWVERELMANFGIRTGFVHRRNLNVQFAVNPNRPMSAYNIRRTAQDPGPDGVAGNADDGGMLTVYDLDPTALAAPILTLTTHDDLVGAEKFSTWEISGTKRMTNNWSLNASFVQNWIAQATQPTGITSGVVPTNPNQFLGSESDGLFHFTTSQAKVTSIFEIPFDVRLSSVARFQAGSPWGRKVSIRMNYGLETIQVEPTSARRNDNIGLLDLRVEKGLQFAKVRAGVFVDVFNVFNGNHALNVVQTSSSNFLRPLDIVAPRIARLGAKFEW